MKFIHLYLVGYLFYYMVKPFIQLLIIHHKTGETPPPQIFMYSIVQTGGFYLLSFLIEEPGTFKLPW